MAIFVARTDGRGKEIKRVYLPTEDAESSVIDCAGIKIRPLTMTAVQNIMSQGSTCFYVEHGSSAALDYKLVTTVSSDFSSCNLSSRHAKRIRVPQTISKTAKHSKTSKYNQKQTVDNAEDPFGSLYPEYGSLCTDVNGSSIQSDDDFSDNEATDNASIFNLDAKLKLLALSDDADCAMSSAKAQAGKIKSMPKRSAETIMPAAHSADALRTLVSVADLDTDCVDVGVSETANSNKTSESDVVSVLACPRHLRDSTSESEVVSVLACPKHLSAEINNVPTTSHAVYSKLAAMPTKRCACAVAAKYQSELRAGQLKRMPTESITELPNIGTSNKLAATVDYAASAEVGTVSTMDSLQAVCGSKISDISVSSNDSNDTKEIQANNCNDLYSTSTCTNSLHAQMGDSSWATKSELSIVIDSSDHSKKTMARTTSERLKCKRSISYDQWLANKKQQSTAAAAKQRDERKRGEERCLQRKHVADKQYKQWLAAKAKQKQEDDEWQNQMAAKMQNREAELSAKRIEAKRRLNEWENKKNNEMIRKRQQQQKDKLANEEAKLKRQQLAQQAFEDWVVKAPMKPKPVPLNCGMLSLRGSVSSMYVNPNKWRGILDETSDDEQT